MKGALDRLKAALNVQNLLPLGIFLLLMAVLIWNRSDAGETSLESRVERALEYIEGMGRVNVVIRTQTIADASSGSVWSGETLTEVPCGAIVVLEGADGLMQMEVTQAVAALLGIPASSVSVLQARADQ